MLPSEFGTESHPLRVSSFPMLIRCPARIALSMLEPEERRSSPAADTGTASHHAISLYHKGLTPDAAIADMRTVASEKFPKADLDEAEKFVRNYTTDPRNPQGPETITEQFLNFTIPPHHQDPTGKAIHVQGTTDQIREAANGMLEVWDYKTGKDDGVTILHDHMLQLAGYSRGVTLVTGRPVVDSGIIRGRGYQRKDRAKPETAPGGVFFHSCFSDLHIDVLLYRIRAVVAGIRRGEALYGPGAYCNHCPHEGVSVCIPKGLSLGLRCV